MMETASTFRKRKGLAFSGFRNASPRSGESGKYTLSRNWEPPCGWNCPSQRGAPRGVTWTASGTIRKRIGAPAPMKQIRILLADDHTVMRRGLRRLLEGQPKC